MQASACNDTSIGITVGNGNRSMYIYNQGHVWSGTRWNQFTFLSKSSLISGMWYTGTAAAGATYYVGYTCQQINGTWKLVTEAGGGTYPDIGANLNDVGAKNPSVTPPAGSIQANSYGSLQAAEYAAGGNVLYIPAGSYSGDLNVNGPTRVIAYGATLHGTLSVSNSTVEGIKVEGGPRSTWARAASLSTARSRGAGRYTWIIQIISPSTTAPLTGTNVILHPLRLTTQAMGRSPITSSPIVACTA